MSVTGPFPSSSACTDRRQAWIRCGRTISAGEESLNTPNLAEPDGTRGAFRWIAFAKVGRTAPTLPRECSVTVSPHARSQHQVQAACSRLTPTGPRGREARVEDTPLRRRVRRRTGPRRWRRTRTEDRHPRSRRHVPRRGCPSHRLGIRRTTGLLVQPVARRRDEQRRIGGQGMDEQRRARGVRRRLAQEHMRGQDHAQWPCSTAPPGRTPPAGRRRGAAAGHHRPRVRNVVRAPSRRPPNSA